MVEPGNTLREGVECFREDLGTIPAMFVATKKMYFEPKRDLFLTLTKWIWCLNLTEP